MRSSVSSHDCCRCREEMEKSRVVVVSMETWLSAGERS